MTALSTAPSWKGYALQEDLLTPQRLLKLFISVSTESFWAAAPHVGLQGFTRAAVHLVRPAVVVPREHALASRPFELTDP